MTVSTGLATVALATAVAAATLGVGGRLAPFTVEDQHGKPAEVGAATRVLVVSHDMDGGGLVKEAFAGVDQAWLDARGVAYVADISGMPRVVSRLFAVPRMRERPYRVLLDRDGDRTRDLPREEGRATVVRLEDLEVKAIAHPPTGAALRTAIEEAAGAAR